jgi:hypothetical protein
MRLDELEEEEGAARPLSVLRTCCTAPGGRAGPDQVMAWVLANKAAAAAAAAAASR